MDVGAAKPSSGHGLVNSSVNDFGQFINFNDNNQADANNHGFDLPSVNASTSVPSAMMSRPPSLGLSGDNTATLHSHHSHGIQHVHCSDYSYPTSSERFNENDDQMSIPLSTPSDFRYTSQYAPYSGTASQQSFEQQFYHDGMTLGSVNEEKKDSVKMPLQKNGLDYFQSLEIMNAPMLDHDSSVPKSMHSEAPPTASAQEVLASSFHPSYSAKSLETYTAAKAMSPTQGSECNEDDRQSSEAFVSGCSEFQVDMSDHSNKNSPPHPGRVFHSEWIPREQAGVLNRLSKSDDPLNSQILIFQSHGAANESIAEAIDPAVEGTEKTNLATWAINLNDTATVDSFVQFEKEYANTAQQTSSFNKQLFGEKTSSNDVSMPVAEKIVGRGKLTETAAAGIERANLGGDHAAMTHHFSWDAPEPAFSTDVGCDPVVPCSTSTVNDSRKEPFAPKTDKRDIAGGTGERTSPDILSDFFANANALAQSSCPVTDPVRSLNMPNYEPQSWSFFRNLAQNEFQHKDRDKELAKIDEGSYPFAHLKQDTVNVKNFPPRSDINVETHPVLSNANVSSILPPAFISSQTDTTLAMKNAEGLQVDNPFTNMHEMMPSVPECEV
jgi:hypothetical protein